MRALVALLVLSATARAVDYSALAPQPSKLDYSALAPTGPVADLHTPAAAAESPPAVPPPVPGTREARPGQVVIITAEWCVPCLAIHDTLTAARNSLRRQGWNDSLFAWLDADADAQLIEELGLGHVNLPFLGFVENGEIIRRWQSGCEEPPDAWTLGWLASGKIARPAPAKPKAVRKSGYPLRGRWWSVDGDFRPTRQQLITHLGTGEHKGQFSLAYLNGLSLEELHSLHSDHHERRVQWSYAASTSVKTSPPPPQLLTGGCPGGNCPMPALGRRGRR